jgi:TATA-binding protein-associated factor
VQELWSVFDFLMPNFLGTDNEFHCKFAKAIRNGQLPGASATETGVGIEKLKQLHQQVLPFILRREKTQVLQELPDKVITNIPCDLGPLQSEVYDALCRSDEAKRSIRALQKYVTNRSEEHSAAEDQEVNNALKSLLRLRLACTHPRLVMNDEAKSEHHHELNKLENSGKLWVLSELLRSCGIYAQALTAADNDTSALYITQYESSNVDDGEDMNCFNDVGNEQVTSASFSSATGTGTTNKKCLIFAQFSKSLDIVEDYLLGPHMPSLNYVRLDGTVSLDNRTKVVNQFNEDDSIQVMLLTTKIGGLGLNLTAASIVIFLEHDWNPHADLQAMDRAHRIGQTNVRSANMFPVAMTSFTSFAYPRNPPFSHLLGTDGASLSVDITWNYRRKDNESSRNQSSHE